MKQTLYYIYYFFGWIIYFLFTLENRNNYDFGISKGMQVEDSRTDLFGTSYKLNPNKKPVRDFMTWKEFWATRKHLKR